jgi:phosphatidylinositol-3-phosphatase
MRYPLRISALVFLFTVLLFAVLIAAIGCGGAQSSSPSAAQQKAPTISFAAQPGTVASGASTVLSWKTSNANSVSISGVGTVPASGSLSVTPTVTTTYTATATGPGGKTESTTVVTVTGSNQNPPPTVSFSAQPSSIVAGASAVLSWTTSNATSVSIAGLGSFGANGSATVTPGTTTTYTATAQGAGGTTNASTSVTVSQTGVPTFGHVFLLMEENHSYSSVIGPSSSSSMPYLNSLAAQYGLATHYFANTHPSLGNYFELTTGQIITNDDSFSGTVSADNVVRHLLTAGKSWKSYAENLPAVGYTGGDVYPYVKHHNPFTYFTDVVNSQNQLSNLVPFTEFAADLRNNQLPQYSFIVPNLQDDGHDGTLGQADNWLKANIAPLIASPSFQRDGLLIILFDESYGSDTQYGGGQVAALVISPLAKKGYKSTTLYQHQNVCRLLMQGLGLNSFPGSCQNAAQMSEFF